MEAGEGFRLDIELVSILFGSTNWKGDGRLFLDLFEYQLV